MGSFNVACSVSNLSINCGDPVYFLPLVSNNISSVDVDPLLDINEHRRLHLIGENYNLIYTNCYFNPFSLPIKGRYGDYGHLEDVERDASVEAIEKLTGLDIELFINSIGSGRHITSWCHPCFEKFSIKKIAKSLRNFGSKFNQSYLKTLGFTGDSKKGFRYKKLPYKVKLFIDTGEHSEGHWFKIYDLKQKGKVVVDFSKRGYDAKESILKEFEKLTGYMISVPEKYQEKVKLIDSLSGMFVHGDVYDALVNQKIDDDKYKSSLVADSYVTESFLKENGFEKVPEDEQVFIQYNKENLYRKEGFDYEVFHGNYGSEIIHNSHKSYIVWTGSQTDRRWCDQYKRNWKKATGSDDFPTPKNLSKPTDKEWNKIVDTYESLTGLPFFGSDGKFKETVYTIRDFKKVWKKQTSEDIDLSKYESSLTIQKYEDFQKNLFDHDQKLKDRKKKEKQEKKKKPVKMVLTAEEKKRRKHVDKEIKKMMKQYGCSTKEELFEYFESRSDGGPFSRDDHRGFIGNFKDWDYFQRLYETPIRKGELKIQFDHWVKFHNAFYSCNRFFFPAMNGEQHGDDHESKNLLEASIKIINKRLEEYEREMSGDEEECEELSC